MCCCFTNKQQLLFIETLTGFPKSRFVYIWVFCPLGLYESHMYTKRELGNCDGAIIINILLFICACNQICSKFVWCTSEHLSRPLPALAIQNDNWVDLSVSANNNHCPLQIYRIYFLVNEKDDFFRFSWCGFARQTFEMFDRDYFF